MTAIVFIISLILAVPTYGASIAAFAIWFFFSAKKSANKKMKLIQRTIEKLGQEGGVVGTAYREIRYSDMKSYAKSNSSKILVDGTSYRDDYIEFSTNISGTNYIVSIVKDPQGAGSILTSFMS
jgi:uncharacterized protein (DUF2141 family)